LLKIYRIQSCKKAVYDNHNTPSTLSGQRVCLNREAVRLNVGNPTTAEIVVVTTAEFWSMLNGPTPDTSCPELKRTSQSDAFVDFN
jgi:hypothetical protein